MRINREIALSFDDVLMVPHLGVVDSRSEVDLVTSISKHTKLALPFVSAPMSSVTGWKMAKAMDKENASAIFHRFYDTPKEQVNNFLTSEYGEFSGRVGAAIGINSGYDQLRDLLYTGGCSLFCIDVAYGYSKKVRKFIEELPNREYYEIIAGSVATSEGATFLAKLGVDAIRVGIGGGAACRTREVSGHGYPLLQSILDIKEELLFLGYNDVKIIADGGIRNSSDCVKALAAGADVIMLGRLLAGCEESPEPGKYWGEASKRQNGHNAPEGVEGTVELSGTVKDVLDELKHGIKSGISYAGATDIKSLQKMAEFQVVSSLSLSETRTRI